MHKIENCEVTDGWNLSIFPWTEVMFDLVGSVNATKNLNDTNMGTIKPVHYHLSSLMAGGQLDTFPPAMYHES